MHTRKLIGVLAKSSLAAGFAAALVLTACGSSSDLSCGKGTRQSGSSCVPVDVDGGTGGAAGAAGTGGSSGASGSGGTAGAAGSDGGTVQVGPTFAGVVAVAPSSDVSLQVSWAPASDKNTKPEDIVYKIYVATASGQQNFGAPQVTTPPGAQSALVSGLQPGTAYFVVVRATNQAGEEDTNVVEKSNTPDTDTVPPTFAGATSAKTVGATSVEVSWAAATDDKSPPEAISYTVLWSTSDQGAPTGKLGKLTVPGATSAVVDVLPDPSTTYYFAVHARDAAGNEDDNVATVSADTGPDVTPPVFGGCVAAGQPGATTVTVSWDPARDDTTLPDDITYNVYAFTNPVDANTPFGVPQTTFTGGTSGVVQGLKAKSTYYFVCRAQDKTGNEDQNIASRVATTLDDSTPPVFAGITSVDAGATSVTLHWNAATDDHTSQDQIVYFIYQSTTSGDALSGAPVAQSNPGDTAITLNGLTSNSDYYWVAHARDKAANESTNTTETHLLTNVSFENDVQTVLSTYCAKSGCHTADNPPQGLNMTDGFAYYNLVDVNSIEYPAYKRVDSTNSDPLHSYMYLKVSGQGNSVFTTCGGSAQPACPYSNVMPPGTNTPPTAADIETIRLWITQGAQNN